MTEVSSKSRSYQRLRLKEFKLNTLLEITKAINNNLSSDKLFSLFEFILRNQLNIGSVILFSNNGKHWDCVLKYGARGSEKHFNVERDLLHIKEITVIESSSKEHLNSFDIAIPVYHKDMPLAYLLLGDLDEQEIRISPIIKHMPFIQTLTNIIIVAIENKRLTNEIIHQERLKRELELAKEMQAMLFPSSLPNNERLQIAAHYQPHQQVGGDYYDFIQLNKDEVLFCLADVSGKGVSAALLMANFQANLRALVNYKTSLKEIAESLNQNVMSSAKGEKFITLFIAKYNIKKRVLKYINAGHNPPLLRNGITFDQLNIGCTGLGMFDEVPSIDEGEVKVSPNSLIVCYTDGVVELEDEDENPFEVQQLKEVVEANHTRSMENINQKILAKLELHKGKMPYIDDIALFSCRFI